jgi:signal transduction histidine kinase
MARWAALGPQGFTTQSLRGRITLGLAISLTLVFTVQWLVARVAVHGLMESFVQREMVEDTAELFDALVLKPGPGTGQVQATLNHIDAPFTLPESGHYFQIMVNGEKALTSFSLGKEDLRTLMLAPLQSAMGRTVGPDGKPMLFGSKGFVLQGHPVTIEIGMGMDSVDAKVDQLLWRFGAVSAAMLLVLLLLQHWVVQRALGVLTQIRADVQRVSSGDLPALSERVPREVQPLVQEINQLSGTLTTRLQRSRNALGNLAHALKTPLSLVMQTAERHGSTELTVPQAVNLMNQLAHLRQRIDLELKRARLAGPSSVNKVLDVPGDVGELVGAMEKLYSHKGLFIDVQVHPWLRVHADREDMLELMGNLLDNACKHAARSVLLQVHDADALRIVVEDDGPGCAEADLKWLTERGTRANESVEGHGLGLAIVADIVASYGGRMSLGRSAQLEGFKVQVDLPLTMLVADATLG